MTSLPRINAKWTALLGTHKQTINVASGLAAATDDRIRELFAAGWVCSDGIAEVAIDADDALDFLCLCRPSLYRELVDR